MIECLVSRFQPICDELFELQIEDYLMRVTEVITQEIQCAAVIFFEDDLNSLRRALDDTAFTSKIDAIIDEIPSILEQLNFTVFWTIIQLSRHTNTFQKISSAIGNCFHRAVNQAIENPTTAFVSLATAIDIFHSLLNGPLQINEIRSIRTSFETALNTNPEIIARILAYSMHSQILSSQHSCPISEIVTLYRHLNRKDVFERTNCSLLIKRVLKSNCPLTADRDFIASIQKLCGSESIQQYEAIIENSLCCRNFCTNSSLRLNYIVFPLSLFKPPEIRNLCPPHEIADVLNRAIGNIRIALPKRRFIWDWGMSTAILHRDELKVKCPASYAIVILTLNRRGKTIDRLLSETRMNRMDLESHLRVLKSKRCAEIVEEARGQYSLTDHLSGIVNIPITIQTQEKTENVFDQQQQENRIDAAIMLILKEVRVLFLDELQTKIESKLEMKINDDLFENRLTSLERKFFLHLNGREVLYAD
jgi:RNAse (barnase) inhibitor barstar